MCLRENNQKRKGLWGGGQQINRRQTFKGEQDGGRGWKEGGLLLLFFVSQCLGSVLCGEIHCRLLTCCFFIFSVCASACVFVYVAKQEVKNLGAGKWKVVERLAGRGKWREMAGDFKNEGAMWGEKINSNMFFLCPGAVLRTLKAISRSQKAESRGSWYHDVQPGG